MSELTDRLQAMLDEERQREQQAEAQTQNDERFAALDSKLDSIRESFEKFAKSAAPSPPPGSVRDGGDGSGEPSPPNPPPEPEPPAADELPVEHVRRLGVPRIYTGDDEPTEVRYVDPDSGEEKTRQGRRKGHPTMIEVEPFVPEAPPPGEGVEQ